MNYPEYPTPNFFSSKNAENMGFNPDFAVLLDEAQKYRAQHNIKAAGAQRKNVHLLNIDLQKSFCFPDGTLYVGGKSGDGAVMDNIRIAEFIYRNIASIKQITNTLDTHFAFQIFFSTFWLDKDGNHPATHTIIKTEDIRNGSYRPNPAVAWWLCNGNYTWLQKQVEFYTMELEREGKYDLYLWPPHCILGSDGHNLAGIIQEAVFFHAYVRGVQPWFEVKGGNPLTENYAPQTPEVITRHDGGTLDQQNTIFVEKLMSADALIIAGQAASHCVKSAIDFHLEKVLNQDPALAKKVFILMDAMSAVAIPDGKGGFIADFTPQAEEALKKYEDAGMNLIKTTDKMENYLN